MIRFPNCKINLGLNILSRRSDGYHDLETVIYPVPLFDALEIIPAVDGVFQFRSSGLNIPGEIENNLCVRAFHLLKADFKIPEVKIHLHKVVPMGSGLGGGSSDGAFTLTMLNDLFSLGLSHGQLKDYARMLGSDCAFFIDNHPRFAFEKGDRSEQVATDLSGSYLFIITPDVHVATAEAYQMVVPQIPEFSLKEVIRYPLEEWKDVLINDFEKPVFEKFPELGRIKQELYSAGAIYASLTGSGSAIYGIFKEQPDLTLSPFRYLATSLPRYLHFGAIL